MEIIAGKTLDSLFVIAAFLLTVLSAAPRVGAEGSLRGTTPRQRGEETATPQE